MIDCSDIIDNHCPVVLVLVFRWYVHSRAALCGLSRNAPPRLPAKLDIHDHVQYMATETRGECQSEHCVSEEDDNAEDTKVLQHRPTLESHRDVVVRVRDFAIVQQSPAKPYHILPRRILSSRHRRHYVPLGIYSLFLVMMLVSTLGFSINRPHGGAYHHHNLHFSSLSSSHKMVGSSAAELVSGSVPWHSLVGQADRAFRLGIQLEKNGQTRRSSAAFHEAVTLYQCFLDSKSDFGHVTSLPDNEAPTILAYACLRLGFLSFDALGDAKSAVRLYKESADLDPMPSAASYEGIGQTLEASEGGKALPEAVKAYRTALKLSPGRKMTLFKLSVALDRLGEQEEADTIFDQLRREEAVHACWVDSWGYVRWHTRKIPCDNLNLYRGTRDMLAVALNAALPLIKEGGIVAEFGVGSGRSLRMTQELLPLDTPIHGFDTFTGLPQAWGNEPAGTYSTGGMVPTMEGKVYFHKGLFGDTIKPFLREAGDDAFLAYANVDCDLYSSTLDILESMHGRVVPGTILVFDEYIGHPTWRQDEFRAWRECCKRFGWKYEYLAFSLSSTQAVVRVLAC